MIHLRSIEIRNPQTGGDFPFGLPVVQGWQPLSCDSPVTFFVGENGSGKSTILETIACAVGSITIGSQSVKTDPTLQQVQRLARQMKLIWNKRTSRGFFLRAEDFFGFIKQQARQRVELEQELHSIDQEFTERAASDYARELARGPLAGQLADMQRRYGEGLDHHSHGESYLELFQGRFVPGGLYLLDEPEAALSPLRQLGFLSLLKEMVDREAQFIIATHSPILMAYPGANILSFDQVPIQAVAWESLEHVSLTRDFLNAPEQFMKHL